MKQETLFRHFRKFGPIVEIVSRKKDDKAHVIFKSRRSATSAKICLNDCVIDGTKITIQYDNLTVLYQFYKFYILYIFYNFKKKKSFIKANSLTAIIKFNLMYYYY